MFKKLPKKYFLNVPKEAKKVPLKQKDAENSTF